MHEGPAVEQVRPPGLEVTVEVVMAEPPVSGAVHATVAVVNDDVATADTAVGLPGTLVVSELEAADAGLMPLTLVAVTVKV